MAKLSSSLALEGQSKSGYPGTFAGASDRPFLANDMRATNDNGYLLQPPSLMMPSTCSIQSSLRARRCTARLDLKTSFSRSCPGARGQATLTRQTVRGASNRKTFATPKGAKPCDPNRQQRSCHELQAFLPNPEPSACSGRLGHPMHQTDPGSDAIPTTLSDDDDDTWKPPDRSSLHNVLQQAPGSSEPVQTGFFSQRICFSLTTTIHHTGAEHHAGRPAARAERSGQRPRQRQHQIWWS